MRYVLLAAAGFAVLAGGAMAADRQAAAMAPVLAFYKAFGEGFTGSTDFATEDWNHINPGGGWTRGREAVLDEVRHVHQTFLKGVSDTVLETTVRFAGDDAAVITVVSVMSPFSPPGGSRTENEHHIRTFVVARHGDAWRIVQDQNTTVAARPPG